MKTIRWRAVAAATALASVLATTACSSGDDEDAAEKITIGTLAWDESLAVTAVWERLLESQGYEVEVKQLDPGPAYQALAAGQIDVFPEQWPNYFREYIDKYEKDLTTLGTWYDGTDLNLAVPEYVEGIDSIADLATRADDVSGRVIGIETGSELMKVLESDVVPGYGLDGLKVEASSTPAMLASLDAAIAKREPIVVTLWRPHWAFAKYPIKALEDPDGLFGGSGVIETVATKGFDESQAEAAAILSRFALTSDQLGQLELAIQEAGKGKADEGAKAWMSENQELVDSWLETSG
ncbi:glycine betaine ABC transporter substrate-binding protein [Nocardioides sp. L-11A]|uniref:glycine betaine ABC transporter substrate-binding protein n=1 Tax=Nocardioides sp. L-11A TaxID=3043848 RepID=UPI00249C8394|nr:glycine betaine ABC transporter substrate-binding protein [Nocardioides sp. L-11A]